MRPGYAGKQKGAFQIAFERGFCDKKLMKNREKVSVHGKETDILTTKYVTKQMNIKEIKKC